MVNAKRDLPDAVGPAIKTGCSGESCESPYLASVLISFNVPVVVH
jgi:hypothetical protein